jgi:hypothetical protein
MSQHANRPALQYQAGMEAIKTRMKENAVNRKNKYSYNFLFQDEGSFDRKSFKKNALSSVELNYMGKVKDRSDFAAAGLIRTLFLQYDPETNSIGDLPDPGNIPGNNISLKDARKEILARFNNYLFWPKEGRNWEFRGVTFWSENHMFLYLSNAYLYNQHKNLFPNYDSKNMAQAPRDKELVTNELATLASTIVLEMYLKGHCHELFNGVYEVNAPSYVHFTTAALLNLYDYAIDKSIRESAKKLLDRIVYFMMLTTDTKNGVFSITGIAKKYNYHIN